MSSKTGGSVIPCSQNSDNNQPMDLAQKSHSSRIAEIGPVKNVTSTLVHIGGNLIPSNSGGHITASKPCIKNESSIAYVRQTNPASVSNVATGSALNLVTPTAGALKSISQVTSLSITSPIINSPPSAHTGCHIPRGTAYVANIAARSQHVASIMRTTSQITPSTLSISGGRSNIGPRVMPMSTTGSNWISRNTPAVLASKVQQNRTGINTGRSNQNSISNVSSYGPTLKSTGLSTSKIQKGSTIKSGIGDGIRMQTPKGLNIAHAIPSAQKYITSNIVAGSGRTISSGSSPSSDNIFSPCSSLVTSLASSGTTITPHPITNRSQTSAIAVRITSAPTSASQVSIQSNSAFGAITLSATSVASPCGTILSHNPATITRSQNMEHHIPIKTPIVRSPHGVGIHHGKISTSGIPSATQITFPGSKLISQPAQGTAPVTLTHISAVSPKTTLNIPSTTNAPFHSRSGTMGRVTGVGIPMAKVVSNTAPAIVHPPTTSSPVTIVGANLPTTTNSTDSHPSVLVQRSPHTAVTVTRAERIVSSLPQYSISTPYFLDSGQGSFAVNSTIVTQSGMHYFPSTINSASLRIPSASSCASSSSDNIPTLKVNSSPRPSILRKRPDFDGTPSKVAKNLTTALSLPISSPPSPKRPESRGNGNFSSTTASANSSPGITCEDDCNGGLKIGRSDTLYNDDSMHAAANCVLSFALAGRNFKTGFKSTPENGFQSHVPLNIPNPMDGMSPRKKPRKQQLMGNELQESTVDEELEHAMKKMKTDSPSPLVSPMEDDEEQSSEETQLNVREETPSPEPNSNQRPHMSLISAYKYGWKARNNHFLRYTDIRLKEERKKTVVEIANQKMVMQKANGWKVVHLTGQFEDLTGLEKEVVDRLETMLSNLEKFHPRKCYKDFEKDVNNLSELYKANIQRSKSIRNQMKDGKSQMIKLFDHKKNIMDILTKYSNKRVIRRKERL